VAAAAAAAVADGAADDGPDAKRRRVAEPPPAASAPAPPRDGVAGGTLVVRQLPARWDAAALRNLLTGTSATAASVRKKRGERFGFITFGFLADRLRAEAELPTHAPDGRPLTVAEAGPKGGGGGGGSKGGRGGGGVSSSAADAATRAQRDVRDAVCPLWAMPHAAQLARKRHNVARALTQLATAVRRTCRGGASQPAWLRGAARHGGMACALDGIVASPVQHAYRNKVEFSLGPDASGAPTVGFNVGLFSEGFAAVAEPVPCANVSPAAKAVALWVQAHLRERSTLPVWDKRDQTGFWRLCVVREGGMAQCSGAGWRTWLHTDPTAEEAQEAAGSDAAAEATTPVPLPVLPLPQWSDMAPPPPGAEVLLLLQVNPAGRDEALVRRECADMAAALRGAAASASPPMPLGALLLQLHTGCSNAAEEDAPVMQLDNYCPHDADAAPASDAGADAGASGVLHERLFSQRFRVSPTAFFQVNTAAAEALYELAGEWAAGAGGSDTNSHSILYDVCCGTGTIGLTLAHRFASVIGVDICAAAVRDAAANAAANGVTNARFEAGRAEDVLPRLLASAPRTAAAVAIADPPRGGLHRSVLSALRATAGITRLVYVSCNADSLAVDAAQLCAPGGGGGGVPFRPVRAMAFDLFPHTKHVEAVLLLERGEREGEQAGGGAAATAAA
jgi:tRNA (uracil-5-)-methyltransferase